MKIGDYVWYKNVSGKYIAKIVRLNPYRLDGSNVVLTANGISEIWRLPHEVSLATEEEVLLWKLENA